MFRKMITSSLLVAGLVVGLASSASAYVGETRTVPSHNGAMASAKLTRFSGGVATATVTLHRGTNNKCVYAQAAPYAYAAADGAWKEVSNTRTCGSATGTYNDSFHLAYNGVKFRICQDNPWSPDSCGDVAYIKG